MPPLAHLFCGWPVPSSVHHHNQVMSTGLRFFLPQSHALVGYRDTLSMLATNLNARRCALVPKLLCVYAYVASTPQTPLANCQNHPTALVRQKTACCRGLDFGIPQRDGGGWKLYQTGNSQSASSTNLASGQTCLTYPKTLMPKHITL